MATLRDQVAEHDVALWARSFFDSLAAGGLGEPRPPRTGVCEYHTVESVAGWDEVGERVRAARSVVGLTQGALAEQLALDRSAVARIESGDRGVSALELARLSEALRVPLGYFVNRSVGPVAAYRSALADAPDEAPDESADRTRFELDVALEQHARDTDWLHEQGFLTTARANVLASAATPAESVAAARRARSVIGVGVEPLGPIADVAEQLGLYIKVATTSRTGASLQIEQGFGVAVVGSGAEPGRRRWTAVHELGHHVLGDTYNSDAGVSTSDREREALVDAFVSEFLLPEQVVLSLEAVDARALWTGFVHLAGSYRLSWSSTVNAALRCGRIDHDEARRLRATVPTHGDFLRSLGRTPEPDLVVGTGRGWRRAVLDAWASYRISASRTVELLAGAIAEDELPQRHEQAAEE